jgi:acyl carrier protein
MFDGLEVVVPMESVQSGRIIGMLQTIRKFIIDNYLFGEEDKLGNEDSFMETGIIDSTGILELVRFLESTYGITVADEELLPDNLDSVNKIVSFIYAKQSTSTPTDGGTSFQSEGRFPI